MAKSIRKAQTPLSCQLCDNALTIKWKCEDCNLLMCENCKEKIHSRVKGADKHLIISTKDIGKKTSENVSDGFGSLALDPYQSKVNTKVIDSVFNTYTTDLPTIHSILCDDDDIVYVNNSKIATMRKVRLLKSSIKLLQTFEIDIFGFSINNDGELLFSPPPGFELHALPKSGQTKVVLNTSPLILLAIHFNKRGELLIGLRDQGPQYEVTDFSTRQVVILGHDYKRKVTIEFDASGRKLFNYPGRITTDSASNIYVIDWFDDNWTGRVVAVDRDSHILFIYNGCERINSPDTPFNPTSITVTSSDNIIVADKNSHALHVLRPSGELIGFQNCEEFGIELPYSLCVDSEGFLLIGCNTYKDEKDEAKLHVVKITV